MGGPFVLLLHVSKYSLNYLLTELSNKVLLLQPTTIVRLGANETPYDVNFAFHSTT